MNKQTLMFNTLVFICIAFICCPGFAVGHTINGSEKSTTIDSKTLKKWSEPYRNWHYYPELVIPDKPNIKGFENIKLTDVPTVFQLPGDEKWYMTYNCT